MKPDPVFSGEVVRAVLLFVVAIAIGGAAVAVATGSLKLSLPDINLPETDSDPVTTLQDTNLSDTTIDGPTTEDPIPAAPPASPVSDPFSTAGLIVAIPQVTAEVGPGAELTRMFINEVQTQFIVRTGGDGVKAYTVRSDDGSLGTQDASITVSGNATIDDFAFKLGAVKPAAIDRMLARARKLSGAADFKPTVLSLERDLTSGLKPPEWTINAEGNGRSLLFRARIDGGGVRNIGGAGAEIPPAALEARKLNECIQAADKTDPDQIRACFEQFSP